MDKASEVIFALRPVSFRYKKEVDAARALSFGLIAEEVAEISPELVTCDREGQTRNCPLRGGECDAAQRVPGRASHSAGIKIRRGEKRSDNFAAQINGGKASRAFWKSRAKTSSRRATITTTSQCWTEESPRCCPARLTQFKKCKTRYARPTGTARASATADHQCTFALDPAAPGVTRPSSDIFSPGTVALD